MFNRAFGYKNYHSLPSPRCKLPYTNSLGTCIGSQFLFAQSGFRLDLICLTINLVLTNGIFLQLVDPHKRSCRLKTLKTFKSLDLAIEFHKIVGELKIKGNLGDQLSRASSSIALNLSEGNAKGSAKDKRNFFHTAYGSLRECQTIFKLIDLKDEQVLKSADQLGAYLYKLVNSEIKNSPTWC
jgi:four helix bundle protein